MQIPFLDDEMQRMELSARELDVLTERGLIYCCDEHTTDDEAVYHIDPHHTWADVDAALK